MSKQTHDKDFSLDSFTGLSEAEASRRIAEEGYNELPTGARRTIFTIAFDVVREPMFLLLVACGTIYFFTRMTPIRRLSVTGGLSGLAMS